MFLGHRKKSYDLVTTDLVLVLLLPTPAIGILTDFIAFVVILSVVCDFFVYT